MPFEDFDKKVIEAAENHHPVYNENAWPQMEKLLDKHLPQKEDNRRRFIFLLLLVVCLGGGAWLIANKPWEKQQPVISETKEKQNDQSTTLPLKEESKNSMSVSKEPEKKSPETENNIVGGGNEISGASNNVPVTIDNKTKLAPENNTTSSNGTLKNINKQKLSIDANRLTFNTSSTSKKGTRKKNDTVKSTEETMTRIADNKDVPDNNKAIVADDLSTRGEKKIVVNEATTSIKIPDVATAIDNVVTDPKKDTVATASAFVETISPTVKKNKVAPNRNNNGFAILFAGGLDKSSVGFAKSGHTETIFGIGASYTFRQRFTISTGVYPSRKIYSASPADYKFAYNPPNINYLKNIDADCKVIEIPLNISWNFLERKKGSWYVNSGASSFIMKNEKYGYVYKYPNGQSYTHKAEYSNKNQHLFSALNLSAGYKRYFGKSFFAAAEPYVKLPINGVGEGRVKLNSTGILFTVGIRPFTPRK